MPNTELVLSFLLTCVAMELTPGPNMTYLALLSAMQGRKAGFAAIIGIGIGLLVSGIIAAVGAAAIIAESPALYHTLRWAGVAYMLWLAYDCTRGKDGFSASESIYNPRLLVRGFLINLFNPKAALFYITVLPNFTNPHAPLLPQTLMLTTISVTIATLAHTIIVLLGARTQPYLKNPRITRMARHFFAALLVAIAAWFAFTTQL